MNVKTIDLNMLHGIFANIFTWLGTITLWGISLFSFFLVCTVTCLIIRLIWRALNG